MTGAYEPIGELDPTREDPYYEGPVEDEETEDDIVNGVDDDDEDGLPLEDEFKPRGADKD